MCWESKFGQGCGERDARSEIVSPGAVVVRFVGVALTSIVRFPLYAKGVERYRYEYAVFLLNKNIEMVSRSDRHLCN